MIKAIYRGQRCRMVGRNDTEVWLEPFGAIDPSARVHVSPADPDLILDPTDEDLYVAEAYECGEISAFEYPDGHTYPPGHEIARPLPRRTLMFRRH